MGNLGLFHLATAIVSIVSGAFVLLATKKGTRRHRQVGWVFIASMLLANGTALSIYRLFGGFGPFHFFAIINLVSLTMGTRAAIGARRARLARNKPRREKLVAAHYKAMSWTFAGLMAAFASEGITRLPATRPEPGGRGLLFGLSVGVATMAVMSVAAWLIRSREARALSPFKVPV